MSRTEHDVVTTLESQPAPPLHEPVQYGITVIAFPILVFHCLALAAFIPAFVSLTNFGVLLASLLIFSQGITLGYHRLLAHASLRVPKWLEYFYVSLALCCLQESPGKWVSTHRRHHNHSDDDDHDPHSPLKSFFWAHIGWLLITRKGHGEFYLDDRYCADLMQDRFYLALERHGFLPGAIYLLHLVLFWGVALGIYLLLGFELATSAWHALGTMVWGGVLRTVMIWHFSWSVNSLTHLWGYQNYETGDHSKNNWLVALVSNGEGWHNNHHHDPASASVQHNWWEFDLTWLHIRFLESIGLATHVVRPRHERQAEKDS